MSSYGTPGLSLGSYAAAHPARRDLCLLGQKAERATASVLDRFAQKRGLAALHDLTLPGFTANLDHVLLAADHLVLLDAKWWAKGWYWTSGTTHRRNLSLAPHAEAKAVAMLEGALRARYPQLSVSSLLVVWGASPFSIHTGLLRASAPAVPLRRLSRTLSRLDLAGPPRPEVLADLLPRLSDRSF